MAMQLAPVAPGLAGMAAVIARGAEPFVVFPPGHALITCAARAINARPLAGGAGHSFRIGLATSLLASGASRATILALCRWQTEESLNIYARLDRETYARHISRALRAEYYTARTTTIDFEIDNEVVIQSLLRTKDSDLTGRAA